MLSGENAGLTCACSAVFFLPFAAHADALRSAARVEFQSVSSEASLPFLLNISILFGEQNTGRGAVGFGDHPNLGLTV